MAEYGTPYKLRTPEIGGAQGDVRHADFNDYDSPNHLRLTEVSGLDSAGLRTPLENRPQRDGSIIFDFWRAARYVGLRGDIAFGKSSPAAGTDDSLYQRRLAMDRLAAHLAAILRVDGTLMWKPTGDEHRAREAATVVGDVISDRLRFLMLEGDASPVGGSYGFWADRTNLLLNGGIETNTTGWNVGGGATIARITAKAKFGVACLEATATGSADYTPDTAIAISGATAGRIYTASVWVFGGGNAVGKTLRLILREEGGASGFADTITVHTIVAGWQRVQVTRTLTANDRPTVRMMLWRNGGVVIGETLGIDGAQIELNSFATPYIETNGATATRNRSLYRLRVTPADTVSQDEPDWRLLTREQGWLSFLIRPGWLSNDASVRWIGTWYRNATNYIEIYAQAGTFTIHYFKGGVSYTATQVATWSAGELLRVTVAWGGALVKIKVHRTAVAPPAFATAALVPETGADFTWDDLLLDIGGFEVGAQSTSAEFLYVAGGTGLLTDAQADWIETYNATPGQRDAEPRLSDLMLMPDTELAEPTFVLAPTATDTGPSQQSPEFTAYGYEGRYWVRGWRQLTVRAWEALQIGGALLKSFQAVLVAADPTIYSSELLIQEDTGALPLEVIVSLHGNGESYPVIRLHGSGTPVTAVTIECQQTGAKIVLSGMDVPTDYYVEVDFAAETVVRWHISRTSPVDYIAKLNPATSVFVPFAPGAPYAGGDIQRVFLSGLAGTPSKLAVHYRDAYA